MREYKKNEDIELDDIMIISTDGTHETLDLDSALDIAYSRDLDLVQMSESDGIAVCKIIDYSRFRFDLQKKDKAQRTRTRENRVQTKEIQMRPNIGIGDLKIKAKQTRKFISQGHKVRAIVKFKGREITHPELGQKVLDEYLALCVPYVIDQETTIAGKNVILTLKGSTNE